MGSCDSDRETVENFELLVRSILLREDQPAIVILGHFSPQVHHATGFGGPEIWHNMVAQFYDVPHVRYASTLAFVHRPHSYLLLRSVKSHIYPQFIMNPASVSKYFSDAVLANSEGHEVMADVLISYFQSQICSAWDIATGQSYDSVPIVTASDNEPHGLFGGVGQRKGAAPLNEEEKDELADSLGAVEKKPAVAPLPVYPQLRVPSSLIDTRPDSGRPFEEIQPFCASANDLINPLPPSLFYGSGWFSYHPPMGSGQSEILHYWYSTLAGSKLRIPISVGAGDIGIYYLKEPMGPGEGGQGSAVECWVDNNYGGAKVIENGADIPESIPAYVSCPCCL